MLWYIAAGSALGGVSRYLVVECVETEEKIQAVLPELDRMIGGGLITLERPRVIVYRPEG